MHLDRVKVISLIIFIILPCLSWAQKENNVWYFDHKLGIDFNDDSAKLVTNGNVQTGSPACISDQNGKLLFYTNGYNIWDRNHAVMKNGSNVARQWNSGQNTLILKKPGSDSMYLVFLSHNEPSLKGVDLVYAEVDMSLNNGFGEVVSIKNFLLRSNTSTRITAINHHNNKDIWLLTQTGIPSRFVSFLVTSDGVDKQPIKSDVGQNGYPVGQLKATLNGERVVSVDHYALEIFDFDRSTGLLSNSMLLNFVPSDWYGDGAEFSPSGRFLYTIEKCYQNDIREGTYQYDLSFNTAREIYESGVRVGVSGYSGGTLQLGPDGIIYSTVKYPNHNDYLATIAYPDSLGVKCQYKRKSFSLGGQSRRSLLPNCFFKRYNKFTFANTCNNKPTQFNVISSGDSILWNFGDHKSGASNYSNKPNPVHQFTDSGLYTVTLISYLPYPDTFIQNIFIETIPKISFNKDVKLCADDTLNLISHSPNSTITWSDDSNNDTLKISQPGKYYLTGVNQCGIVTDSIELAIVDCPCNVFVPNAFSPNYDGINDVFLPFFLDCSVSDYHLDIYNQWGQLVFQTTNNETAWDGFVKGSPLDGEVYMYIITYNLGVKKQIKSGVLHILN